MPATFTKVSSEVPSAERSTLITDVEAGDRIDLAIILGRPARGLKFIMGADTDEVEYRLNNLRRLPKDRSKDRVPTLPEAVDVWSAGESYPVYSDVGLVIELQETLQVSSLEVVDLTLGSGDSITIVAW